MTIEPMVRSGGLDMRMAVLSVFLMLSALVVRTASAQAYLPNNNQWTGDNVYQGAVLILAYDDGNARTFTPEQVTLFNMTSGWLTGAAQMIGSLETLDRTPHGSRCLMHFQHMTLVDVARKYAGYWVKHPEQHDGSSLDILINAMYEGGPCR